MYNINPEQYFFLSVTLTSKSLCGGEACGLCNLIQLAKRSENIGIQLCYTANSIKVALPRA